MKSKRIMKTALAFILVIALGVGLLSGMAMADYAVEDGVASVESFEEFKAAAADDSVNSIRIAADFEVTEDLSVVGKPIVVGEGVDLSFAENATLTHQTDSTMGGFSIEGIEPGNMDSFYFIAAHDTAFILYASEDGNSWNRKICGVGAVESNMNLELDGYYLMTASLCGNVELESVNAAALYVLPDSQSYCSLTVPSAAVLEGVNYMVDGPINYKDQTARPTNFDEFKEAAANEGIATIWISGDVHVTEDIEVLDKIIVIGTGCSLTFDEDVTMIHTNASSASGGLRYEDISQNSTDTFVRMAEDGLCFISFRGVEDGSWYRRLCGNAVAVANAVEVPEGYMAQSVALNGNVVLDQSISTGALFVYPNSAGECSLTINKGVTLEAQSISVDGRIIDLNDEDAVVLPFTDVADNAWYYDEVAYVYSNELMNGTAEGIFSPDGTVTRAMIWTILARMDGADLEGGDNWYAKAQEWAMENEVSDGTDPNGAITREQFVTMLYRFMGEPEVDCDISGFADAASVSGYAESAVQWAVENGIFEGNDNNELRPTASASRAEAAAIIMRYCEL